VIELKDQKTKNLDIVELQTFNYHNSHSNSRYIIISNFDELRFYIDKKTAYVKFSLFNLTYDEFKKLHLILSFESIKANIPLELKEKSINFEADISKELYQDFSLFRNQLFENIMENNTSIDKSTLLRLTQKLCDRIIFILFAEDMGLLRYNTIKEIREHFFNQAFTSYSLYEIYKFYFDAINQGNSKLDIVQYNGGLFAKDELLDSLIIDDEFLNLSAQKLSDYDFGSDISVNILGHIFEQSLTDLEELYANIDNSDFDKTKTKRKKDGIFYTPERITHYIIEQTIGKICLDKKIELGLIDISYPKSPRKRSRDELETLKSLYAYREYLLSLKVLDTACGSGAFLNQALEFFIKEHKEIDTWRKIYENEFLSLYDIETNVLENNLYGVDVNEDAVEIAKLSLWLRTAQKGRILTNLSEKVKCANSLLEMPFEENFFDVVIGNPPYVRQEMIKEFKPQLQEKYETFAGTADLYVYFYELAIKMLKQNGLNGFICSNKFFRAKYGTNLRAYILEHTTIQQIVDFNGVKVFEDATVDSAITILKKQNSDENSSFRVFDSKLESFKEINQADLSKSSFTFADKKELEIKKKIESVGTPLKEWDIKINYGIKTGFNEAFIIDGKKRDELISKNALNAQIIKKLLRGRDIVRYGQNYADKWLIATFNGNQVNKSHRENQINIDEYPDIKEHLNKYLPQLEKRLDQGDNPYLLRSCDYWEEFEKEKIVYSDIGKLGFCYDDKQMYLNNTVYFLNTKSKYILAVLNSKAINYWYSQVSSSLGIGGNRGFKIFIEQIPIPKISLEEQEPFIKLVDEILEAKEKVQKYKKYFDTLNAMEKIELTDEIAKLEEKISQCENEIDTMVYKLYGLNSDEITIVMGFKG
jgi:type II restriction/modification system DNA methylase subunit YeeA